MSTCARTPSVLRATYTSLAPFYDEVVPLVSSTARAVGRDWLAVEDGEQVLDVGTGTGLALNCLAAGNPTGWTEGVDLTPSMLSRARHRLSSLSHSRYGLRLANAAALPYPPNTFDAVFASYFLDVLPRLQIRPVLHEMHRVLSPQGRVVLVYLTSPSSLLGRLWGGLAHAMPPLVGGARPISLDKPLRECGFEETARTTCRQLGLRSAIIQARIP